MKKYYFPPILRNFPNRGFSIFVKKASIPDRENFHQSGELHPIGEKCRTLPSVSLPIIPSLQPSKRLTSKFITSPSEKRSPTVALKVRLANHQTTDKLTRILADYSLNLKRQTLYNYYQIPVLKTCLYFTSLRQYNINSSTHVLLRLSKTLLY